MIFHFSAYFTQLHNSTLMNDDTISISSTLPTSSSSSAAPELPRRSNSIISMSNHNNTFKSSDHITKPLLSPRHPLTTVSPKILAEELRAMEMYNSPDPVSPSTFTKPRSSMSNHHITNKISNEHEKSSPSFKPSSPRCVADMHNTNGQSLPISPHVNVPPSAQSFNHKAPPLPPREKKHIEISLSQKRQAKDAPLLQPRDKSPPPPPLPPRLHTGNSSNTVETWNSVRTNKCRRNLKFLFTHFISQREDSLHMTQLEAPGSSTLMQRRHSAQANNRDSTGSGSTASTPRLLPSNPSYEAKNSPGAVGKNMK